MRFNARIIESLGNWVWCVERSYSQNMSNSALVPWEGFLYFQLDRGANPLMRYSSHLLTALLYGVSLYLFVVIPRTVNRSTRTMMKHSGCLFFAILACVSLSYDCPYGESSVMLGVLFTILLAILGATLLFRGFGSRFETSNACRMTEEDLVSLEAKSAQPFPESISQLRKSFDIASSVIEPCALAVRLTACKGQEKREERLKQLKIDRDTWKKIESGARGLIAGIGRLKRQERTLRRLGISDADFKMAQEPSRETTGAASWPSRLWAMGCVTWHRLWLGLRVRPRHVEEVTLAEEDLWSFYFGPEKVRESLMKIRA